jgi:hypothetical protein
MSLLVAGARFAGQALIVAQEAMPSLRRGHAAVFAVDRDQEGDLEDGDLDELIGNGPGEVWYFKRQADQTLLRREGTSNHSQGINVGYFAAPFAVDWDHDGDLDEFIGNENGRKFGRRGLVLRAWRVRSAAPI